MAWEGWMSFNGSEIINNRRASVYAGNGGIAMRCTGGCDLNIALDDPAYTYPADVPPAGAEWYDPAVPESARFYGVAGLEVTGLGKGPGFREPVGLVRDGAAIGPLIMPQREVMWRVLLLGADDCALSYGLAWLTAALKGSACLPSLCAGGELCFMTCCPHCTDEACGARHVRTLFDAGLLESPAVTAVRRFGGGSMWEVEFTMVAGKPWIFRPSIAATSTVAAQRTMDMPVLAGVAAGDVRAGAGDGCVETANCLSDPLCPDPPLPPQPPALVDPCWPKSETLVRRIYSFAPLRSPEWLESVPVVRIYAGSGAMRTITVKFYANPLGLDCSRYLNELCGACDSMSVLYLPAASTLVLDGRVQRASVDCPGGPGRVTASPKLYGPNGGLFSWPVFACGVGLCVEVSSSKKYTSQDATVTVELYAREDAA